ncbi:MAG: hypothetical protein ACLTBV_01595 [Enterocloster bolteae]
MDIQIDMDGCEVIETALDQGDAHVGEYSPDFQKAVAGAGAGRLLRHGTGQFHHLHARRGPWAGRMPGKHACKHIKKCVVKVACGCMKDAVLAGEGMERNGQDRTI